jgi:hypothetical protein
VPGSEIQPALQKAIDASRHVVLVISEAWLAGAWTLWEGGYAAALKGRVLPVFRVPYRMDHPHYLYGLAGIKWLAQDREMEAHLWQLRCSLDSAPAGPPETWAARWQELLLKCKVTGAALHSRNAADESFVALRQLQFDPVREVLCCDRDEQWGRLVREAEELRHGALFVVGPRRRGHDFFLERVRRFYPKDPARLLCPVLWDPIIPTYRQEFREALAAALHCEERMLSAALRAVLRDQNLVLIHRPVYDSDLANEALQLYYTKWVPELLSEAEAGQAGGCFVKLVQAVAWSPARRIAPTSAGGEDEAGWYDEGAARRMLKLLAKKQRVELPVVKLKALTPIRRREIRTVSEVLPEESRKVFIRDMLFGAPDSEQILKRLTDRLRRHKRAAEETLEQARAI